ncbi:hypothetical protein [Micromonospora tulbaghiae]|uniref:hypothetical protein n=1 Tax=Micromonospora tulbaghiae TaxID=479978 RepID=UPI000B88B528|nr:hypothetical protein [Micromonospora tulbaghiae]
MAPYLALVQEDDWSLAARYKVLIHVEQRLIAVVVAGDAAVSTRFWVCVAPEGLVAGSGWLGCWSIGARRAVTAESLRRMLEELEMEVARAERTGLTGAFLDDHIFIEGWDTWGGGVPAPIAEVVPAEAVAGAVSCRSSDDLVARLFSGERRIVVSD